MKKINKSLLLAGVSLFALTGCKIKDSDGLQWALDHGYEPTLTEERFLEKAREEYGLVSETTVYTDFSSIDPRLNTSLDMSLDNSSIRLQSNNSDVILLKDIQYKSFKQNTVRLLDLRESTDYLNAHISGFENLPMSVIENLCEPNTKIIASSNVEKFKDLVTENKILLVVGAEQDALAFIKACMQTEVITKKVNNLPYNNKIYYLGNYSDSLTGYDIVGLNK